MSRWSFLVLLVVSCHRKHGDAYKMEQVAAQGARACAAMKDGTVKCWGRKGNESVLVPTLANGMTNVAKVCVADDFECAMTRDGKLTCSRLGNVTDLACGAKHVCAISSGRAFCFERDQAPREIPGTAGATAIAAGGGTTCALFDGGAMKCWGAGKRGQLGSGAFEDKDEPQVVAGVRAKNVCVGGEHACAVLEDETMVCFGSDDDGELGDGRTEQSATPRRVENVNIAQQVSCGAHHTCARMGDSTVHCWGKNDVHQSGISNEPEIATPKLVPGLYESTAVVCGNDFTCVRMQDGWLRCFGVNDWGQLADGTHDIRNVPNPITY
jgi:alpha-tubulin suppressor-like RCC1 family protein